MNKIYRVVWNETTQTWNAVAEFAKAHGKTASSGIGGIVASAGVRFAFTAIMSGLLLASGQVMAAENSGKTLANGKLLPRLPKVPNITPAISIPSATTWSAAMIVQKPWMSYRELPPNKASLS